MTGVTEAGGRTVVHLPRLIPRNKILTTFRKVVAAIVFCFSTVTIPVPALRVD